LAKTRKTRFTLKAKTGNSKNKANEATMMPRAQNAKKPMNIDNAFFTECVNFTHHASISRVIDKQRVFHTKNA